MSETGRTFKRKRIKLPGGATIDIPVIAKISFIDAADRGQEIQYTIDNSTDSDRTVHVASILGGGETDETGNGGPSGDPTQTLQVERIDEFKLLDAADRGQETWQDPDSKTVQQPPDAPPYFTTHTKTHIVKYIKRNEDDSEDSGLWLKSELIDEWHFGDAADRGQETQFILNNPSEDNQDFDGLRFGTDADGKVTISVDPSMEEITTGVGGNEDGDAPVRTDPFQNIVDISTEMDFFFPLNVTFAAGATPGIQINGYHWYIPSLPESPTAAQYPNSFSGTTVNGKPFTFTGSPHVPDTGPYTHYFGDFGDFPFVNQPAWWIAGFADCDQSTIPGPKQFNDYGPVASLSVSWPIYGIMHYAFPSQSLNGTGQGWQFLGTFAMTWPTPTLEVDGANWKVKSMTITTFAFPGYDDAMRLTGGTAQNNNPGFVVTFEP